MKAIVYTKDNCQECERIKMLLISTKIPFLEYKFQKDFTENQFFSEFGKNASFPQVAIDYEHVGNLKETLNFLKKKGIIQ